MPRICTVCALDRRGEVDAALVTGRALRELSALYRVSEDALARHRDAGHVAAQVVRAQADQDVRAAIDVVRQLKAANAATLAILSEARQARDHEVSLKAIARLEAQITLQAKLLGELDERPRVNVILSAEWLAVQAAILGALAPWPEARVAVASGLLALEGAAGGRGN